MEKATSQSVEVTQEIAPSKSSSTIAPTDIIKDTSSKKKNLIVSDKPSKKSKTVKSNDEIEAKSVEYGSSSEKEIEDENPYAESLKSKKTVWFHPELNRYVSIYEMNREYESYEKLKRFLPKWKDMDVFLSDDD